MKKDFSNHVWKKMIVICHLYVAYFSLRRSTKKYAEINEYKKDHGRRTSPTQYSNCFPNARGVAKGGALGARAPPLEKKCLEGTKGLKKYLQEQRFSPLACTPLRKFLATPLRRTFKSRIKTHNYRVLSAATYELNFTTPTKINVYFISKRCYRI
jgi:hypothetical protein